MNILAALCGQNKVLTYLLKNTPDIDAQDGYGNTPLVLATRYGHPTIAQVTRFNNWQDD